MQLFLSFLSDSGLCLCVWVYFSAARSHLCALTILVSLSCGSHSLFEQQTKTEINWWEQKEKQRQKKNTHTRIRISNEVWPMWTSHHFKIKKKKQMLWINLHETIKLCREVYWTVFCLSLNFSHSHSSWLCNTFALSTLFTGRRSLFGKINQ